MSSASVDKELDKLLYDFDKRCPECYGEGHGGDGCEFCWNHNVEKDAVDKLRTALKQELKQSLEAQIRLEENVFYDGFFANPEVDLEELRTHHQIRKEKLQQKLNGKNVRI